MLPHWVMMMFMLLQERWAARRSAQIRFLKLQLELLKQKLPGNRVILSPADRKRLLRAGAAMNHDVHDVMGIVSVKTYKHWLREEVAGRTAGQVGRPRRLTASLRALILRLARENTGWGVRRILGELKKLALRPGRSTVRRVLVQEGVLPDPARHAPKGAVTPWRTFVAAHVNTMVACDFFCKSVLTPMGRKTAYVLVFIHLGSRRVLVSPSTCNPNGDWIKQQARNVQMWAEDQGVDLRFLLHDRDTKFTQAFDDAFKSPGGGVVRTPFQAPIANCYIESWIGSLKRECLNHLCCLSLGHLDHVTQTYVHFHNTVRPHQGLGNVPIPQARQGREATGPPSGRIRREQWLGGLLKHYYREAA